MARKTKKVGRGAATGQFLTHKMTVGLVAMTASKSGYTWSPKDIKPPKASREAPHVEPPSEGQDDIATIRPGRIERKAPHEMPDDAIQSMRRAAEEHRGKPTTVRRVKLG